jgi:hypothetical protein
MSNELASRWKSAAKALGIEIEAPYSTTLSSGSRLDAAVLVAQFGAPRGMLILRDYAEVRHLLGELEQAGFGFSVMDEPGDSHPFVLEEYMDVLRDWGWSGIASDAPAWIAK